MIDPFDLDSKYCIIVLLIRSYPHLAPDYIKELVLNSGLTPLMVANQLREDEEAGLF